VFCTQLESIQHLFFECHFAKFMWTTIHIAFNIPRPHSILHLFNDWATTGGLKNHKLCLIGAAALIWALWTSRNDLVFDNSPTKTYMQVLFQGTYWLSLWAHLQKLEDDGQLLLQACGLLETLAFQFFTDFGWCFKNRIGST
jgi:hypothetical protein